MDAKSLAKEIEQNIDEHYLYSNYVNTNGTNKGSLKSIIENYLVHRTGANAIQLSDYIKNKMFPLIKPLTDEELKEAKFVVQIEDFVKQHEHDYIEYVVGENGEITNFREFLLKNYRGGYVNDNGEIEIIYIVPETQEKRIFAIKISHVYKQYIEAAKKVNELQDKLETIAFYEERLVSDEVKKCIYKDGKTFEDFLHIDLPNMMTLGGDVSYVDPSGIDVTMYIDLFIKQEVRVLLSKLENEKEDYFNKVNENPSSVPEIKEFDLPEFKISDEVKYFNDQLFYIQAAIYRTTTIDDLDSLIDKFDELCNSVSNQLLIESQSRIISCRDLIVLKQNNIIKQNNNMSDYINSILERLIDIEKRIELVTSHEEHSTLFEEFLTISSEVYAKNIHDSAVLNKMQEVSSALDMKRYNTNSVTEKVSVVEKVGVDKLDILLSDIRVKCVEYGFESNEIRKASIEVKINSLVNEFNSLKNELYKNGILSAEDVNQYIEKLESVTDFQMEGVKKDERRV